MRPGGKGDRCLKIYFTKRSDQCILGFGLINALLFDDRASASPPPSHGLARHPKRRESDFSFRIPGKLLTNSHATPQFVEEVQHEGGLLRDRLDCPDWTVLEKCREEE
jgi:hypothetical protein